jgi:hypothetical protein
MARRKQYKPIKEESFWDSRARYDDLKTSGELFIKYPDMVGIWSYDMMKFLCNDDVLHEEEKQEEEPKKDIDTHTTQWYDKKEEE